MKKKRGATTKNSSIKRHVNTKRSLQKKIIHRTPNITHSEVLNKKKEIRIENILVENFISLQKVMVNLTTKFDRLGTQMSSLLSLFEKSAEALAKKEFDFEKEEKDHKKILDQINNVLDQNKTIARGLALMHEVEPEEEHEPISSSSQIQSQQPRQMLAQTLPQKYLPSQSDMPRIKPTQPIPGQEMTPRIEEYQKSISAQPPIRPPSEPADLKSNKLPEERNA